MTRLLRILLGCSAILAILAMTGCDDDSRVRSDSPGSSSFTRAPTLVVIEPASIRTIREQVEAIGTTSANESITLTAQVTDTVSVVGFEDGQYVNEGDILVELTNSEETALLAESKANRDDAATQFARLENLGADGSVPLSDVDEARSRLAAEEARYQSVLARLDDRLIRAPFSGLLGFRQISTGTLLSPGTPITTLDDISIIKLDFSIPEVFLALVEEGMELQAMSSAFPDQRFDATVRTIGSRVDPITRSAVVRAHIANPDQRLRPGMLLTVRLTTAERTALMVPEAAMLQRASQAYVYTVNNGLAEMVQIENGVRYDGWVEVLSGLSEGTPVVAEGIIKIREGSAVTTADQPSTGY